MTTSVKYVRRDRRPRQWLPRVVPSVILTVVLLAAVLAPVLAPGGPNEQNLDAALQGPSVEHIFGTDSLGRDLLVRLMYGAQPTIVGMLIAVSISVVLGVLAGVAGAHLGGKLDQGLSLISDSLQAVPLLLVLLIVAMIFPSNIYISMAVFGLFSSAPLYRVMRGSALGISAELYVMAARAAGVSEAGIVFRHLIPRLGSYIRVQTSIAAAIALTMCVSLGFLGLDVTPPAPSWGAILADASQYLSTDPWMLVPPIAVVCLTILALGMLGDARQVLRGRVRRLGRTRRAAHVPATEDAQSTSERAATAADALLSIRGLTVRTTGRDPFVLVQDVSFDVHAGEVVGLVGESGAGKSVTAGAILRLDGTDISGSVQFDGIELVNAHPAELRKVRGKRIAYIGQDPMTALDPLVRVGNQMSEALRRHQGISRDEARQEVRRLLGAVRIPDPAGVAAKYPHQISGGMAQRVAIALALAGGPELLIADEPTTALDVTVQMEVLGLLKSVQRERGMAMLIVTHDWGVVADICDRAVTVYAGEVVEIADVRTIFQRPAHPYTLALRSSDPHLQHKRARLATIPGSVPAPGTWPSHCRFADRCPFAVQACRETHPALLNVGPGEHQSRCLRSEEVSDRVPPSGTIPAPLKEVVAHA